jgi:hypothetical protein
MRFIRALQDAFIKLLLAFVATIGILAMLVAATLVPIIGTDIGFIMFLCCAIVIALSAASIIYSDL